MRSIAASVRRCVGTSASSAVQAIAAAFPACKASSISLACNARFAPQTRQSILSGSFLIDSCGYPRVKRCGVCRKGRKFMGARPLRYRPHHTRSPRINPAWTHVRWQRIAGPAPENGPDRARETLWAISPRFHPGQIEPALQAEITPGQQQRMIICALMVLE